VEKLTIALAAGFGALARYALTALPAGDALTLVAINAVGCLLIGAKPSPAWWSTGFLGGFTSFSTYMLISFTDRSALYLFASAIICVAAWFAGDAIRRRTC